MSKEILLVVDAVSNEKGVGKDVIFGALEAALASAARKLCEDERDVRVDIDRSTGEYDTFRRWEVVEDDEEMEFPDAQIAVSEAQKENPEIAVGEFIEEPMENAEFGRIAAQTAKQVIVQRVREAEREQVVEAYKDRAGELMLVAMVEHGEKVWFFKIFGDSELVDEQQDKFQEFLASVHFE